MALPSSGPISASQIALEFGSTSRRNIGAYRISDSIGTLSGMPLDDGIPQSGAISFSDFRGKRLNIVVPFYGGTRVNGRTYYNNGLAYCVGRLRSRPSSSSGTKVYINPTGGYFASDRGSLANCAIVTGNWDSDTTLFVEIGSGCQIFGAGGNGGHGGNDVSDGGFGSSGLGIQYSAIVNNRGYIQAGYGGGGGGGYALTQYQTGGGKKGRRVDHTETSSGGGGGGGAGYPEGAGGPAGTGGAGANSGSYASRTVRGNGGGGGSTQYSIGGAGGPGGDPYNSPQAGQAGQGNVTNGPGGNPGSNGHAIIYVGGTTINNYGSIVGTQTVGTPT
jgi:hypothetical protein